MNDCGLELSSKAPSRLGSFNRSRYRSRPSVSAQVSGVPAKAHDAPTPLALVPLISSDSPLPEQFVTVMSGDAGLSCSPSANDPKLTSVIDSWRHAADDLTSTSAPMPP